MKLTLFKNSIVLLLTIELVFSSSKLQANELVIALGNFEPLFSTPNKPALYKELIDGVYAYLPHITVNYQYMFSNSRLLVALNEKKVDGVANIFAHSEIDGCISLPIFRYSDVAISRTTDRLKINEIKDLQGLSVVTFQRAKKLLAPEFEKTMALTTYYQEIPQPKEQARILQSKMADVSVGDKYIFFDSLNNITQGKFNAQDYTIHNIFEPSYSHMGFNNQQDCDEFNVALAKFKQSGEYEKVYERFFNAIKEKNL